MDENPKAAQESAAVKHPRTVRQVFAKNRARNRSQIVTSTQSIPDQTLMVIVSLRFRWHTYVEVLPETMIELRLN
jgi:hypothetical protein